uniref:Putative mitochondrial outer membrane protein n=1 Tax=Ixodes ricinus TaxID=34613 RepID=A0A090XEL8_IXORI
MPSVLLTESIAVELGAHEPWPDDAKVFQSFEKSQILLPESASSLGVQTFLRMAGLDHEVEMRANVESISPSGNMPVLKCGSFVIAEMDPIVAFVNTKGIQLTQKPECSAEGGHQGVHVSHQHRACLVLSSTSAGRMRKTYNEVTKLRYGSVYPWPLESRSSCFRPRKTPTYMAERLLFPYVERQVLGMRCLKRVQTCCAALSERLGQQSYFFGDKPTELDALTFGHLYSLMTTDLVDGRLGQIVRRVREPRGPLPPRRVAVLRGLLGPRYRLDFGSD